MYKIIFFILLIISEVCFAKNESTYEVLDMELQNKLPFVKFKVENQEVKLLLDTGARNQVLVLDKNILAKLQNIIKFPRKFKSSDVTGKEYIARKYILPKFNIGSLSFNKIEVAEDTNWGLSTGNVEKKDGVVGLALFVNKAIIIDYPNQKLVVMDGKYPPQYDINNWQDVGYKIDHSGLSIFASIDGGVKKKFILDSGSNISIIKPNSIGSNQLKDDCNVRLAANKPCSYIETKDFSFSGINHKGMFFYIYNFTSPIADGILGYDFLTDKILYIDFDKRIMKIKLLSENK
jgi:hypothetical protein